MAARQVSWLPARFMAASEHHGVVTGRLWFDLPADFRYFRTALHL